MQRMSYPVYVLLPEGVEWTAVAGTTAQKAAPVRWYLRQSMPEATTQTAVLVEGADAELEHHVTLVARQAETLGGIAVDAMTQTVIDPRATVIQH
jgi:hypothetical protein